VAPEDGDKHADRHRVVRTKVGVVGVRYHDDGSVSLQGSQEAVSLAREQIDAGLPSRTVTGSAHTASSVARPSFNGAPTPIPAPSLRDPAGRPVNHFYGTGRRKTASARVFLRPGHGAIVVNDRPLEDYFPRATLVMDLLQPLQLTDWLEKVDAKVTVKGGGMRGQAGAIRLGLARALIKANPSFRPILKPAGLLTRDARKVERKKPGRPKARKRFQFSKR